MSSPGDGPARRSSWSSFARASVMILSTSFLIQSPPLAPGEASALIRVEAKATRPTLIRPISAASRSTWSKRTARSSSWSVANERWWRDRGTRWRR